MKIVDARSFFKVIFPMSVELAIPLLIIMYLWYFCFVARHPYLEVSFSVVFFILWSIFTILDYIIDRSLMILFARVLFVTVLSFPMWSNFKFGGTGGP